MRQRSGRSGTDAVLTVRGACAGVSIISVILAVWNWALLAHRVPVVGHAMRRTDWLDIPFVGFIIALITGPIAVKSSLWADRIVFGALTIAFAFVISRARRGRMVFPPISHFLHSPTRVPSTFVIIETAVDVLPLALRVSRNESPDTVTWT